MKFAVDRIIEDVVVLENIEVFPDDFLNEKIKGLN